MSQLFKPTTTQDDIMEGNYDRPVGVSVLAVLMAISGAVTLVTQLSAIKQLNQVSELIGVSHSFLLAAISFLGVLGLAGGVGMWLGKKWGWWLAIFYFAYSVTRNVNVLLSIQGISDQYNSAGQAMGMNYVKYGIRVLWNGFLLFYMFSENVTTFLHTTEMKKWKALLIVFACCVLIFIGGALLKTM